MSEADVFTGKFMESARSHRRVFKFTFKDKDYELQAIENGARQCLSVELICPSAPGYIQGTLAKLSRDVCTHLENGMTFGQLIEALAYEKSGRRYAVSGHPLVKTAGSDFDAAYQILQKRYEPEERKNIVVPLFTSKKNLRVFDGGMA